MELVMKAACARPRFACLQGRRRGHFRTKRVPMQDAKIVSKENLGAVGSFTESQRQHSPGIILSFLWTNAPRAR